jgi:proline iminopeptidase
VDRVGLDGDRQATFEVVGEGVAALMLPGGPGLSARYMRGTAELLHAWFASYLVDPHGSGGSSAPADPASYSPEGHAHFYEEVRAALGLDEVILIGHSFGATTALTYAALFPEVVDRVIAIAAFGMGTGVDESQGGTAAVEMDEMLARHAGSAWHPKAREAWDTWTERILAATDPAVAEEMFRVVLPLYVAHPDDPTVRAKMDEFGRDVMVDLTAMKAWEAGLYQGIDLRPAVGQISCPTLLVAGELDLICGPAQAGPIHDALPDSTLQIIPDCGHMAVIEKPDELRHVVLDWLG